MLAARRREAARVEELAEVEAALDGHPPWWLSETPRAWLAARLEALQHQAPRTG